MKVIKLHGYIGKADIMSTLFGDGSSVDLDYIQNEMKGVTGSSVKIEINSGGGDVNEGFAIVDYLRSTGKEIHTEVLGLCGSIATVIALAAKPEHRSMHPNSEYFIHNPYWTPQGPEAMEAKDLEDLRVSLENAQFKILNYYLENTSADEKSLKTKMDAQTSLTAQEAKEMGFISVIVGDKVKASKERIFAFVSKSEKPEMENKGLLKKILAKLNLLENGIKATKIEAAETLGAWMVEKGEDVTAALVEALGQERYDEVVGAECPTEAEIATIAEVAGGSVDEVMELAMADGCAYEAAEDVEALKAERDSLKAELETIKTDVQAEKDAAVKMEAKFTSEIATIKAMVLGADPEPAATNDPVVASKYASIKANIQRKQSSRKN